MMPESPLQAQPTPWEQSPLGSVASVNPEALSSSTPPQFRFRYIDISSVAPGRILWEQVSEIAFGSAPSRARRVVRPNDVLLCTVRPGLQAHAFAGWTQPDGHIASTGFAVIRSGARLHPRFLYHLVFTSEVALQLRRMEVGTNYPAVNESDVKCLRISLPECDEQRRIAEILDMADEAIQKTEALIAKLKAMKAGLLHDLLTRGLDSHGRLRDPAAHPEHFKDSSLGRIPAEWDVPTVGSVAVHVGSGLTPTGGSRVYKTEGVLFIRSQNVTFDGLLLDDVAYIDPHTHKWMSRSEVFPHDVLLNITGASIGRCCPLPEGFGAANVNQHVCAIRLPKPRRDDAVFLAAVLGSYIGQHQIDRLNAGSNRQGLNYAQLRSFVVPWPKEDERVRIAGALQAQDARIRSEEAYLAKLKAIKKGLMHDLLTGRVRVRTGIQGGHQ